MILILAGAIFYYLALREGTDGTMPEVPSNGRQKTTLMLVVSMAVLLVGAHFTVTSATSVANSFGVNPILIGMLIVGLGTTMPELFFSLRAIKKKDDSLAIGDLLGTVLADATIVVGILALVSPFAFPQKIIYVTGAFMLVASFMLFRFMKSKKAIAKKEAHFLFFFWIVFIFVELLMSQT